MITAERLRQVVCYDAATGVFVWMAPNARRTKVGMVAGSKRHRGYISICIDGRAYLAHRLAWLYVTGSWPHKNIDHINGNCGDNRFVNLRPASHAENMRNARKRDNKSGFKGVSFYKAGGTWRARIGLGKTNKQKTIGYFRTPQEAFVAYCEEAKKRFGEFARVA